MAKARHAYFTIALPLLLGTVAQAQAVELLTPHRVAELRSVSAAVISPDGKHVAYTVTVPRKAGVDEDGPAWSELHLYDVGTGQSRPFVTDRSGVSRIEWNRDGRGIAFLSKRASDKESSLYVISLDGGEARKAASLKSAILDYSISPDGRRVALVASPPEPEAIKKKRDKGFKQEVYEEDWRPAQVWIAELFAEESEPKALTIEGSVHRVHWSPVDDRLAIMVAATPSVDDRYMRTRVRVIDAANGKVLAGIENPGKLGEISWSPDGRKIAMLAGADIHDPAPTRLMLAPSSGGTPTELMPKLAYDFAAFAWQSAEVLMVVAHRGVSTTVEKLNVASGETKTIVPAGGPILTSVTLSKDGQHGCFVGNTPSHPGELFTMSHGEAGPKRSTDSNAWLSQVRLASQESVRFKARDGLELEGILIRPIDEVKGQRYPLVLDVHGGPEAHHSNVSRVGTTDIPDEEYYVHALKRPWEDWTFQLQRSPIYHADNGRTPLLILHGKDDPRVDPGQSREMYRHLKLRGKAPVRLVFYPGEGHGNRKAAARLDYSLRSLQWLEHYLKGPGGNPPPFDLADEDRSAKKE